MAWKERAKTVADWVSWASILFAFVVFPVWAYMDPDYHGKRPPGTAWPIEFILELINMFPLCFGSLWIIFRYGPANAIKHPFVRTSGFRALFFISAIAYGTTLSVYLGRK
jgi:hypothetical protein